MGSTTAPAKTSSPMGNGQVRRILAVVSLTALAALGLSGTAQACSTDDKAYFDTFLDTSCLASTTNTEPDALGGLRLTTNGASTTTAWDSDTEFSNGITHEGTQFPPIGYKTVAATGSGAGAKLTLPPTLLPLTPDDSEDSVLEPTASAAKDSDNVVDPSVIKVGGTYVMYYSGTAEDGSEPAIFQATSSNGETWNRANNGNPVLEATADSFDQNGVFAPEVIYDANNQTTPYKMYYSGKGEVFGAIGLATSTDGVTWTKHTGSGTTPVPVLDHGQAGSADSFSAADPSVLKDGETWKMWYTGDDSNKKRIAYATSDDGIEWSKGGKVIAPEDAGASANIEFGSFAPTVWKSDGKYRMLLTGRKSVGSDGEFQTKIMSSESNDGIAWSGPSPAINPSGNNGGFDYSNLNAPDVFEDPGSPSSFKAYYSGNTVDTNGNFHTRIGLAESPNGTSFSKFNGGESGDSVLDIGTLSTAFDARQTSGLTVTVPANADPATKFVGFYSGVRGSDFKPRLGEATSADGSSWDKVSVSGANGGALFGLGNQNAFDNGGHSDPSVLYESSTYNLYFTALDSSGDRSIGFTSTPEVVATKLPNNSSWTNRNQVLTPSGSGFDANGVSHPSVIKDGANYVMYYTGTDSSGVTSIGRATSTAANFGTVGPQTSTLSPGPANSFDSAGAKDPVVVKVANGDYRMLYTAVEIVESRKIERVAYAISSNGNSWTKQGPVLNPSQNPYGSDEVGVQPTGATVDGSNLHIWASGIDRSGRSRGIHASSDYPTPVSAQSGTPNGWATYQLGSPATTIRDFRQISRTSNGKVALWVSFLQPYASAGKEFWSDFFPVTVNGNTENLNFLLTVKGMRWQARLADPASTPELDKVELSHAPISFAASGSATTNAITPPAGQNVTKWNSLVVNTSLFSPNGGGTGTASLKVLDATSGTQLANSTLNTGGDTTVDLSGVSSSDHKSLKVQLDLSSNGQATPLLNSLKVLYNGETVKDTPQPQPQPQSGVTPTSVTPPPVPVLTLGTATPTVTFGRQAKLTGKLTQGTAPLGGKLVNLFQQPQGQATLAALAGPTTDATGTYSALVKPTKRTTYKVTYPEASSQPTATVSVKHLVTLALKKKGRLVTLSGRLGPSHRGRTIVIQQRKGTRWVTFAKVKTSKKSLFKVAKRLKRKTKYSFRARTAKDTDHLAGLSTVRKVTIR